MAALRLTLLAIGVVGVLARPSRWPAWAVPTGAVAVGLATGAVSPAGAEAALRPLASPLTFLLLAVPLALLLDEAGFFASVAARIDASRHLPLGLWLFAAAVTTLFNLDAAVGVVGANLLNNLPALLVALPALDGASDPRLWAVLTAVNVGPVLAVAGSLAGLLWLDTVRRLGVDVDVRTYSRVGVRVGLPALAAATVVLVATNALAGP